MYEPMFLVFPIKRNRNEITSMFIPNVAAGISFTKLPRVPLRNMSWINLLQYQRCIQIGMLLHIIGIC